MLMSTMIPAPALIAMIVLVRLSSQPYSSRPMRPPSSPALIVDPQ